MLSPRQRRGQRVGCGDRVLNGKIDADPANRRHGMGGIADRQQAGPVLGWTSAVAAYGAFIAPVVIGDQIKSGTPENAMYGFAIFYALCLILNWWFYLRKGSEIRNP